ncbi:MULTISPECIES: hypothetical protein [unclassified Bradyrhizobium]|uniref:hypothetical protein n=1 Tax=unclassified Bradyrhizobium TaxID=2631580 RepID=UPI0028E4E710|nr:MULTISPECIES: hypothetical protein [unclassified Bradyrhizobium]
MERELRLHTGPKHKNLYSWAINEFNDKGNRVGEDQIPWPWSQHFIATSAAFADSIDLKTKYGSRDAAPPTREITERQVISVGLRPRDDGWISGTKFSMFGTDRAIKSFELAIEPLADPAEQENCTAWGTVSYTSEIDFRNSTTDDCVVFYLAVKPETFARYAAKLAAGSVDEIAFRVSSVAGFYAEWSPGISTSRVKVLTRGDEHRVQLPEDVDFEPPRLGEVGAAALHINRRLEFAKQAAETHDDQEPARHGTVLVAPETKPAVVAPDPQTLKALKSLKRAAWFIVSLLTLIFLALVLRS